MPKHTRTNPSPETNPSYIALREKLIALNARGIYCLSGPNGSRFDVHSVGGRILLVQVFPDGAWTAYGELSTSVRTEDALADITTYAAPPSTPTAASILREEPDSYAVQSCCLAYGGNSFPGQMKDALATHLQILRARVDGR